MCCYGYVRVSSKEQNEDRQIIALNECNETIDKIFIDKESGKNFNRTNYKKMKNKLKSGDVIIVKSLDRFGRSYKDILEEWQVYRKKGVYIKVLDMPILDTSRDKDLMGTLISDIVLQLLSYVAETERKNIKERQAEGIAAAKKRGVKFGRPRKYNLEECKNIIEKYWNGELTYKEAIENIGCSGGSFHEIQKQIIEIYGEPEKRIKTGRPKKVHYDNDGNEVSSIKYSSLKAKEQREKYKAENKCIRCGEELPIDNKYLTCRSCRMKQSKSYYQRKDRGNAI